MAEAFRLQQVDDEERAKQIHLDSLYAQRIAEEQELSEGQQQRKAQVQFEAQYYSQDDWDIIRAKLKANAELSKSIMGGDLQGEDFATKMNQGTWKIAQLKKLSFDEVKAEFDKLVKQVDEFEPISFKATKEDLKRFGKELQSKVVKKQKTTHDETQASAEKIEKEKEIGEAIEQTKKGSRKKQMARKGLSTKKKSEDASKEKKPDEKTEITSGTNIPINPVPVTVKSPSVANYKIIGQGKKAVYQIIIENGTDIVYISFGAMISAISRDDLTELYRIVMKKYGMEEPEDELEKVLWSYLKNMFDTPLSTDSIWSLPGQQKIILWRYYPICNVHCLSLESTDIYMLAESKYPLSADVCKEMLNKKLQGAKQIESCYQLLKSIEKQAGLRRD
ncbi:hypothetical protein Tco_0915995 [Tanacetum coccineum]